MVTPVRFVYANTGGMKMQAKDYWNLFMDTGAPELFLCYTTARKLEERNVSKGQVPCAEGNSVQ